MAKITLENYQDTDELWGSPNSDCDCEICGKEGPTIFIGESRSTLCLCRRCAAAIKRGYDRIKDLTQEVKP